MLCMAQKQGFALIFESPQGLEYKPSNKPLNYGLRSYTRLFKFGVMTLQRTLHIVCLAAKPAKFRYN